MPFIQLGSVKRGQEKVRQLQMSETHKLNGTADAVLMRDSHVRRTLYQYFYTGEIDTQREMKTKQFFGCNYAFRIQSLRSSL